MKRYLPLSLTVILACACASANAIDPPKRKPGLWEINMQTGNFKRVTQMCVDPASEAKSNATTAEYLKQNCSKNELRMEGGKLISDSECTFAGQKVTGHTVTTYNGENAYRTEGTTTVDAKWLGPCKPGQVPGVPMMQR